MGKASRWLLGFFGMKKEKERTENPISSDTAKEKKRWSFARTQNQNPGESSRLGSYEEQHEQSMHAIAVAAATAAAADAAVVAAHAAVEVVRLTSRGRGIMFAGAGRETLAAVKIQNVFRGHLARKALRALKSLVKLQALVRGFIVRKRTAATYHSMQALIRAQFTVRSQRAHHRRINKNNRSSKPERHHDEFHSKRLSASSSRENADQSPKIVEMDTSRPSSRSRRIKATITATPIEEDMYYHYYFPTVSSPLPGRHSVPDGGLPRNLQEWGESRRGMSAQSTPRFSNSYRMNVVSTPAKSESGGDSSYYRQDSNFPNYMMNTESFCAKLRSHSAPRQRAEAAGTSGTGGSSKKRMSLNEIMSSRNSFSGVRMNQSCAEFNDDSD